MTKLAKFSSIILSTLVICSCSLFDSNNGQNNSQNNSNQNIKYLVAPQNVHIDGSIAKWNIVEHSIGYIISCNSEEKRCDDNSFNLDAFNLNKTGDYPVKIKALGDGVNYESSSFSETVSYHLVVETVDENIKEIGTGTSYTINKSVVKVVDSSINSEYPSASYICDNFYYYFWYLGSIEDAFLQPVSECSAQLYNGTEFNYSFSRKSSTEESITKSMQSASSECSSVSEGKNVSQGFNIELGASSLPHFPLIGLNVSY